MSQIQQSLEHTHGVAYARAFNVAGGFAPNPLPHSTPSFSHPHWRDTTPTIQPTAFDQLVKQLEINIANGYK
jgi:hypothetical protein